MEQKKGQSPYVNIGDQIENARKKREAQIQKGIVYEGMTVDATDIEKAITGDNLGEGLNSPSEENGVNLMPVVAEFKKAIESENFSVGDIDLQLQKVQRHLVKNPYDVKLNQMKGVLIDRRKTISFNLG